MTLPVPHEERFNIVQDALLKLESGKTTDQIAKLHNIKGRTLRAWLLVDCPAAYEHQRARYFASELQGASEAITKATDQLQLAKGRELLRHWQWLSERRLPSVFGQKQEVRIDVNLNLAERLTRARDRVVARVIEHENDRL